MSIAGPRYAASAVARVGRSQRTLAIFLREIGARSGWATWIVIAFAFITNLAILLVAVELPVTGPPTLASFYRPMSGDLWPLEVLLVAAVVGSGGIAEDLTSRSITMYLSRPIHLEDYLAGKAAAVAFWIALVSVGPGIVGAILAAALGAVSASLALTAIAELVSLGALVTFLFTSLALALSAWSGRALYAGVAIFGLVLALQISALAISGVIANPQVPYLAPFNDLQSVAQALLETNASTPTVPWVSAVLVVLVGAVLLVGVWSRLRRVEVVGE
jgi:ABC-type transport system involved in multi-copper enzyme maturation permease subunit